MSWAPSMGPRGAVGVDACVATCACVHGACVPTACTCVCVCVWLTFCMVSASGCELRGVCELFRGVREWVGGVFCLCRCVKE